MAVEMVPVSSCPARVWSDNMSHTACIASHTHATPIFKSAPLRGFRLHAQYDVRFTVPLAPNALYPNS
jgi:hypothetical protein